MPTMPSDQKFPTADEMASKSLIINSKLHRVASDSEKLLAIYLEWDRREIVEVALPTAWDLATDRCTSQACDNPWGPDEPPCRRCVAHELRKILGVKP